MQAWDRMKGETPKAFEAFCVYRDMPYRPIGRTSRSYKKVAQELKKSETIIGRWGGQWNWQQRMKEFDAYMMNVALQVQEESFKDRIRDMHERHSKLASATLNLVVRKIRATKAEDLTPSEMARMLELGVKIEREALGQPGSIHQVDGSLEVIVPENIVQGIKALGLNQSTLATVLFSEVLEKANREDRE